MKTDLTQPQLKVSESPEATGEFDNGLEIIDAGLERHGIVPVDEITITQSGLAIYRVNTELTDGSLEKAIEAGAIDWIEATQVTLDALRLVSEMHEDKEIEAHGDINPKTIFIDRTHETGAVSGFYNTVIDEKALAIPSLKAVLIGAQAGEAHRPHVEPAFTAPEVINGSSPNSKSDVYEAARTLLYALRGTDLGPTVEYEEFMGRLDPAAPPELTGDFPSFTPTGMRIVIQSALNPHPQNRPTMDQLVSAIGQEL